MYGEINAQGDHRNRDDEFDDQTPFDPHKVGDAFEPYHQDAKTRACESHRPVRAQADSNDYHRSYGGKHDEQPRDFPLVGCLKVGVDGDAPQSIGLLVAAQNLLNVSIELLFTLVYPSATDPDVEGSATQFLVVRKNVEDQCRRCPISDALSIDGEFGHLGADRQGVGKPARLRVQKQLRDYGLDLAVGGVLKRDSEARVGKQNPLDGIGNARDADHGAVSVQVERFVQVLLRIEAVWR